MKRAGLAVLVSLSFIPSALGAVLVTSTDVPVPIPDLDTATSTLTAPAFMVADVDLILDDLQHTCLNDLRIQLSSPTGTTVALIASAGSSGILNPHHCPASFDSTELDDDAPTNLANGSPPFTGSFNVDHVSVGTSPLSAFQGESATGTWTLTVIDQLTGDSGSIEAWSLRFVESTIAATTTIADVTSAADLDLAGLALAQDLGANAGGDVVVDGVTFHQDAAVCKGFDGCEDSFSNGAYNLTVRGEQWVAPNFEPTLDGSGGASDDLEDVLGGFRHHKYPEDPPPASRALEIEIGPLDGGAIYRLQLLSVDEDDEPGARIWDIVLSDGATSILVADEFDVAVARESNFNDAAALVSVDFRSSRLGTYTLLVNHPKDYNGNDPGEVDRTGVVSAFTLEVLAPFLDGFESGDVCAWSNRASFGECED